MSEQSIAGHMLNVEQMQRTGESEATRWSVPVQGLGEGLMRLAERLHATARRGSMPRR